MIPLRKRSKAILDLYLDVIAIYFAVLIILANPVKIVRLIRR